MSRKLTNFYSRFKIKKKTNKIKHVKIMSIVLTVVVVMVLIFAFGSGSTKAWMKSQKLYFVVADYDNDLINSESLRKMVEDAGGAGVLADLNDKKNSVIIMYYNSENDAEKIKDNCIQMFNKSSVVCIETQKISNKIQNNNNYELCHALEFIVNSRIEALNYLINFERGDINFSKLYEYVFKLKSTIKNLYNSLGNSENETLVRLAFSKFEIYLNDFLESNLKNEFSSLSFKKYIVALAVEDVLIRANLK